MSGNTVPIRQAEDAPAVAIATRGAPGVRVANLSAGTIATVAFGVDDKVVALDGDIVVMPGEYEDLAIPSYARFMAVTCPGQRVNLSWFGARASANDDSEEDMSTATVKVTAAQLKNLRAAPITLVAAPGSGHAISLIAATLDYEFGTVAYTGVGAVPVITPYSAGEIFTGFLDQLASRVTIREPAGVETKAAVDNLAMLLKNTGASDLAAGDGTLTITVQYRIVTLG